MQLAFNFIILLASSSPLLVFLSSANAFLFQMLLVSAALFALAAQAGPPEAAQLRRVVSGMTWVAALVPSYLVFQLLPLPALLAHPVWASANEAAETNSFGHITADLGATLAALIYVLTVFGLVLVLIAVGRERKHAELILILASAVAPLSGLLVFARDLGLIPETFAATFPNDAAIGMISVGLVLNLALFVLAKRRHKAEGVRVWIGAGAAVGVLVNAAALVHAGHGPDALAVGFGSTLFVALVVLRYFNMEGWFAAAFSLTLVATATILAGRLLNTISNEAWLLRLAPAPGSLPLTERLLGEATWFGAGAGTFEVVSRIYQESDALSSSKAPSTAITWVIELGWTGLFGALFVSTVICAKLYLAALRRGRDWVYAGAGAASIAVAAFGTLTGNGLQHPLLATTLTLVVGLGLSQSVSSSSRP